MFSLFTSQPGTVILVSSEINAINVHMSLLHSIPHIYIYIYSTFIITYIMFKSALQTNIEVCSHSINIYR